MKKNTYFLFTKMVALVMMLGIAVNCVAFSTLPESELVWKNVSGIGKKMSVYFHTWHLLNWLQNPLKL